MPDAGVHYAFGREVYDSLPQEIQKELIREPYTVALYGPDPWFMYRPRGDKRWRRGRRMHTARTGAFLTALAKRAGSGKGGKEMFSYLAGFLCHYALDSTTHPYIIWETTEVCSRKAAHRALEHSLDVLQMEKDGVWGGLHALTDNYLPGMKLPAVMREALDSAYREVYGWEHCLCSINRCYALYRCLYRLMEKPKGFFVWLTKKKNSDLLRSLVYSESYMKDADPANTEKRTWRNPYDPETVSDESFAELREKARISAVKMITEAWERIGRGEAEQLAAVFGSRSYLSGLDVSDPKNMNVPSLLPGEP